MSSPATEAFDVIVIGGGPGGSTTSTLTAQQGHRVLLLEKETFPRYQIGESLLPPRCTASPGSSASARRCARPASP